VYANPILLVDLDVELGSGLRRQLARHGFCADLAITVDAARACVGRRYYHALVVVTDLSNSPDLVGLQQLREEAPQTWMVVLASKPAKMTGGTLLGLGADAYLLRPLRFTELLLRLESFAHYPRVGTV
jgi:DNA-binding response OmpR family regulator